MALSALSIHHAREGAPQPAPTPTFTAASLDEAFDAYEQATLAGDKETQAAAAGRIRAAGPAASGALGQRLAAAAGSPGLSEHYIGMASEMGAVDVLAKEYRARPPTDAGARQTLIGGISTSASPAAIETLESLYRFEPSPDLRSGIEGGLAAAGAPASRIAALRREPSVAERAIKQNLTAQTRLAENTGDATTASALREALRKVEGQ